MLLFIILENVLKPLVLPLMLRLVLLKLLIVFSLRSLLKGLVSYVLKLSILKVFMIRINGLLRILSLPHSANGGVKILKPLMLMRCLILSVMLFMEVLVFMEVNKMAKKRKPLVQKHARKLFTVTAKKVKPMNVYVGPMRGGIRM